MAVSRWQRRGPRGPVAAAAWALAVVAAVVPAAGRATQTSAAAGPCSVSYQVNQWTGGFTASVALTNNAAPLTSWTLTWTFGGNQQITSAWNAQVTQSGPAVRAASLAYDAAVPTGATVSFGFQGTFSGSNAAPADFSVNGAACNGAAPSASPSGSATPTGTVSPAPSPTLAGGSCPAGAVFCDGFENQATAVPSGRWSSTAPNCSGTGAAAIDSSVAHTGAKSVKITGAAGYCNHAFADDVTDMPSAAPDWYVRFWIMHTTPLPSGHVTFLAMNDSANGNTDLRLGGQNGALVWNRQSDDATLPDQSPAGVAASVVLPVGAWECVEFEINGSNGQISTWFNGASVPGLTEDGVATPDVDDQWLSSPGWRPRLTDLKLGWESYSAGSDTLWFDDVALATTRIGCG
jgi:Cip1-like, core domain/Cellulose binding domain